MLKIDDTYTLNAENIDKISEKADQVCQSLDMPSDQKIRIRLFIEEVLIEWLEKSEKDVKIVLDGQDILWMNNHLVAGGFLAGAMNTNRRFKSFF